MFASTVDLFDKFIIRQTPSMEYPWNKTFKVGLTIDEPYILPQYKAFVSNPRLTPYNYDQLFPGTEFELLYSAFVTSLHLQLEYVEFDNYVDLGNALKDGAIDLMFSLYEVRDELATSNYIRKTPIIDSDRPSFIVRKKAKTNVVYLLSAFDMGFRLFIFASLTGVYCLSLIAKRVNPTTKVVARSYKYTFYFLVTLFTALFSNLLAVNFSRSTTANVLPFKSLTDLGNKLISKECRLAYIGDKVRSSEIFDRMIYPVRPRGKWEELFQKAYHLNPPLAVKDRRSLSNAITSSDSCIVGADFDRNRKFYEAFGCNLRFVTNLNVLTIDYFILHRLPEQVEEEVSKQLAEYTIAGLLPMINDKYYHYKNKNMNCKTLKTNNSCSHYSSLALSKLYDIFVLTFVSLIVGILVFGGEMMVGWRMRRRYDYR